MSTLTINNAIKSTLPTQIYCFQPLWGCNDSVHNCPDVCGRIVYLDEYGDEYVEEGYCVEGGIIQITASSIISHIGMNLVTCS